MSFLTLANVSKSFGSGSGRHDVLADVTLNVERGEFVAIVGYSGSGKTTLISLLAGLLKADSGQICLDGEAIQGPGADRGVVFQNYSLLPWLTVHENVALAVDRVFPSLTRPQRDQKVRHYLMLVNLSAAAGKYPSQLSGGMRQRVSVARALSMDPEILLLDEPLSALDALTRATLQDEIVRIRETDRKTVILITNDVDEGILMADRLIPLSAGPAATLGPSFDVQIPRPRDRKGLNHDPEFKRIRREVVDWLLASGHEKSRREPSFAAVEVAPALT